MNGGNGEEKLLQTNIANINEQLANTKNQSKLTNKY